MQACKYYLNGQNPNEFRSALAFQKIQVALLTAMNLQGCRYLGSVGALENRLSEFTPECTTFQAFFRQRGKTWAGIITTTIVGVSVVCTVSSYEGPYIMLSQEHRHGRRCLARPSVARLCLEGLLVTSPSQL